MVAAGLRPGWQQAQALKPVVGALVVQRLLGEEASQDPQGLLEAADGLVMGEAEGLVLTRGVARPQPEHEPPLADVVERGRDLGQEPRVAVAGAGDEGADGETGDLRRQGGEQGEALQVALCLDLRVVGKVDAGTPLHLRVVAGDQHVVGDVERVEAHVGRRARDREDLGPVEVVGCPGGQDEAESQPIGGHRWAWFEVRHGVKYERGVGFRTSSWPPSTRRREPAAARGRAR